MERATDPHLIEMAERALREYRDKLSIESISIFRKDGTLLYSSEWEMVQRENVEQLFLVLEELVSDFVVGDPVTIIAYDGTNCLIIRPLIVYILEGWYIAFGRCSEIECEELSNNLRTYAERRRIGDLSTELETEENRIRLKEVFDLPRIIGREFEKNDDTVLTIDGKLGFVMQSYDKPPTGIRTVDPQIDHVYPSFLDRLEHLEFFFQYETRGLLYPLPPSYSGKEPNYPQSYGEKKPNYYRSNRILMFLLIYGFALMIAWFPDSFLYAILAYVFTHLILLFLVRVSKEGEEMGGEWMFICCFYLLGVLTMVVVFSEAITQDTWLVYGLGALLLPFYFLVAGMLFTVIRLERAGVLTNMESDD